MKYYDNSSPNVAAKTVRCDPMPVLDSPAIDSLRAQLAREGQRKYVPTAVELVEQLPEVVAWLRAQMTAKPKPTESGGPKGGSKSRPPFRVAFMDAADREVAALLHWAEAYGVSLAPVRVYRVNGQAIGVMPGEGSTDGLATIAERLIGTGRLSEDDSVLTDSRYGLWSVRSNHYSIWPELAGMFLADRLDDEDIELAAEAAQEQEALF